MKNLKEQNGTSLKQEGESFACYFFAPPSLLSGFGGGRFFKQTLNLKGVNKMDSMDEIRYQMELERLGELLINEIDDALIDYAEVLG